MIRVCVAASSALVRAGLEAVVRSGDRLELVAVVGVDQVHTSHQDINADVLLIELPHIDDEWQQTLRTTALPVVLLTDVTDTAALSSALRVTVHAVLSHDATPEEIVAAICAAFAGLVSVQRASLELLTQDVRRAPPVLDEPLSPRELQVLGMLAEGLSNKIIAHELGISEHTVKFHVTSIMGKLRAGSRTEAVMQGIRRGLVTV